MNTSVSWLCILCLGFVLGCGSEKVPEWRPGEKLVLISSRVNNGSFEDWSGTEYEAAHGDWRNERIQINQGGKREESTSIPGWRITANTIAGFEKLRPTSHLHSYAFGMRTCHFLLVSEPRGQSSGFVTGSTINVSYDAICHFTDDYRAVLSERGVPISKLLDTRAALVFDTEPVARGNYAGESEAQGSRVLIRCFTLLDDYIAGNVVKVEHEHTLSEQEAEEANRNGIRLAISTAGYNTFRNLIDNVKMTATKPIE